MGQPLKKPTQRRLWLGDNKPVRAVKSNTIYQGDNLSLMKELEPNKIDLIYIDPPFCSQSVQKSKAWGKKIVDFNDSWGGGVNSYIRWLVPRLRECHRLLKDTDVFCLHLDYRSVHYAKIELDKIFGRNNFVNEIIWLYKTGGSSKKYFSRKHDTILCYAKDFKNLKFNYQKEKSYLSHKYGFKNIEIKEDKNGFYTMVGADIYRLDPFKFERQMVKMIAGTPNLKQVGDGGIDGRCYDHTPIQVKKSFNVGRPVIDAFYKHIKNGNGRGVIIARSFSKGAYEEVDRLYNEEDLLIDLVPSDDIIRVKSC